MGIQGLGLSGTICGLSGEVPLAVRAKRRSEFGFEVVSDETIIEYCVVLHD